MHIHHLQDEKDTKENHKEGTHQEQTNKPGAVHLPLKPGPGHLPLKSGAGHLPLKTGDGQYPLCLPTINGNVVDLHSITPQTLNSVLQGKFADKIKTYRIIDCRYPYEFAGGHIKV